MGRAQVTLSALAEHYGIRLRLHRLPIEIPNTGRDQLPALLDRLGFRVGVEVGVEQGLYSEVIARGAPKMQLHCVDAWKAYPGYRDHVSQRKLDRFYEAAKARVPRARFHRAFSLDAVRSFEDESIDFVYIDAAHDFQSVTNDIAEWGKKLRPGGIIAGHDYARYRLPNQIQVVEAVQGWTKAWEIRPWFLLGTTAKRDGEIRDTARSWLWVKAERQSSGRRLKQ